MAIDKTYETYAGWKRACKAVKPDVKFEGDKDICCAFHVGEWDGASGVVWKEAIERAKADNPKGE